MRDRTGNLPPRPGIFPYYPAPIVRNAPDAGACVPAVYWNTFFVTEGGLVSYGVDCGATPEPVKTLTS